MKHFSQLRICLWAALLLSACLFSPQREASRGSVVDNEITGILYHTDGTSAANARVRVYPVDHVPDSSAPAYVTTTNSSGRYFIDSLPNGEYNVLGDLNSLYSFLDSIPVSSQTDTLPPDTLDAPGSMAGIVGLQPGHNPVTVTVQVLGTNNFVNVDSGGRFQLSNLARGQYRLQLSTTLPEYTPLYTAMTIRAAQSDTFPDTLWLPYTGIPVVTGLRAAYDTLRGVVHLSWDSVNYSNFSRYEVYRDSALSFPLSLQPVGIVTAAAFDDSLLFPAGGYLFNPGDTVDHSLEYRVKVRNQSDQLGLNYGYLPVLAVAPSKVMTSIGFRLLQVAWDSLRQADSTMVAVDLRNVLRGLTEISWALGRSDSIVATRSLSGNALTDTLRFGWANQGPYIVYIRVRDGAGLYWADSLRVLGNSAPVIGGSPVSTMKTTQEFLFTPTASDPDFDVLRFSAANLPSWISLNTATGQLRGTPVTAQAGLYSGILLQVSDGRRSDTLSFDLTVALNPWTIRQSIQVYGNNRNLTGAATLGGRIYTVINDFFADDSIYSYNPVAEIWSSGIEVPGTLTLTYGGESGFLTVAGEILAFTAGSTYTNDSIWAYDTASRTWAPRNSAPSAPSNLSLRYALSGGKVYQIRADSVNEYDPLLNAWNPKQNPPFQSRGFTPSSVAAAGGKIYVIGYQTSGASVLVFVYDPAQDAWSDGPQISSPFWNQSLCAAGGNVYVMGGSDFSTNHSNRVEMLDAVAGAWMPKTPAHTSGDFGACAEFDGKLYVFGFTRSGPTDPTIEQYDPSVDN